MNTQASRAAPKSGKAPNDQIMKIERVFVEGIDIGDRLRPLNERAVQQLVESFKALGQLQPISVFAPNSHSAVLVTGRHRLEAARRLEWEEIDAIFVTGDEIDRQMQEIAENLHRAELSALERDVQVSKWISLTEAKLNSSQIETKLKSEANPRGAGRRESGINAAARELGISKPDAHRAVRVASLSEEAKDAARNAGLDNNRSAMLAASHEAEPAAQVAKISEIAASKIPKPVKLAPEPLNDIEASRKWRASAMAIWNRGSKEDREWFLASVNKPLTPEEAA